MIVPKKKIWTHKIIQMQSYSDLPARINIGTARKSGAANKIFLQYIFLSAINFTLCGMHTKGFKAYLQLEKSLSDNSVEAYLHDVDKLTEYLQASGNLKAPEQLDLLTLQHFIKWVGELGMTPASQARIISGIRGFISIALQSSW